MTDSLFELVAVTLAVAAAAAYCVRSLLGAFSTRRPAGCGAKTCGSVLTSTSRASSVTATSQVSPSQVGSNPARRKLR